MKKAILVVSFGTSVPEGRQTIENLSGKIGQAFPDRYFMKAWTSRMIRKSIERKTREHILSVEEALEKLLSEGCSDLLVQPTFVTAAREYDELVGILSKAKENFTHLYLGNPLLTEQKDIAAVGEKLYQIYDNEISEEHIFKACSSINGHAEDIEAMADHSKRITAESRIEPTGKEIAYKETSNRESSHKEIVLLMGHGSEHPANDVYGKLDHYFEETGAERQRQIHVAAIDCSPSLDQVLPEIKKYDPEGVILAPLLVTAGLHAREDLAGNESDSWKSRLEAEGLQTECIMEGIGAYPDIQEIYIKHAKSAGIL